MMTTVEHQYIDRISGSVMTERLYADQLLQWMYAAPWEDRAWLLRALTSARASRLLSFFNYDLPLGSVVWGVNRFIRALGVDLTECVDRSDHLDTSRKVFERKIRYWERRPMENNPHVVVSPSDARVLLGSFATTSSLFLKGKFFHFEELFGADHSAWLEAFRDGDFAIFRLTPEKYHYNHTPVAGVVAAIYTVTGSYHSCNPGSVVSVVTPYSKNTRVVTILDTDVPQGTQVGLVAMIEVVALMIGTIEQCYSAKAYGFPVPVTKGMFLEKGQPKSLYHPGSSTTVLVFQRGRVLFAGDLIRNMSRREVRSRFSQGFGQSLVETDLAVRSTVGWAHEERRGSNGQ